MHRNLPSLDPSRRREAEQAPGVVGRHAINGAAPPQKDLIADPQPRLANRSQRFYRRQHRKKTRFRIRLMRHVLEPERKFSCPAHSINLVNVSG